jgi:hypothetical protein
MKVVSFKISDDLYYELREKFKNQTFRSIYETLTLKLLQNPTKETTYTGGIQKNSGDLYEDLALIQKTINKILKSFEFRSGLELMVEENKITKRRDRYK